jgi:ubiquinol-cytochrome c reductase cytochrome b subunit
MPRIGGWLDKRLDLQSVRRALLDREVPDRLTWWHTLGSAILTVFTILVLTGIVLATYYSPSPDHAYESVRYIDRQVAGGSFLRGIHHWAASAMVVLVMAHMIRVFVTGAYKFPREANWLLGVFLFVIVMGFSFTGYLLPWDQKAYWATQVGTAMAGTTPGIGGFLLEVLRGGAQLGAATLTRFYAFHVLWLPGLFGALVLVHIVIVIRQGIGPSPSDLEFGAPPRTNTPEYAEYYRDAYQAAKRTGIRFWPDIIAKDIVVSTAILLVILLLAAAFGSPLEVPADPNDASYVPRPEWYFLPLYQLLKMVPGSWEAIVAVGVPTVLIISLLALPLLDTRSKRSFRHRPLAVATLVVLLAASGLLFGAAIREAGPKVPAEVGRVLSSKERAGRSLFRGTGCLDCHIVADEGSDDGPDLTDIAMRHSMAWLHSYMEAPSRFDHEVPEDTSTRMPAFGPPVLSHQEIDELATYLVTLRGNAPPDSTPDLRDVWPDTDQ